jgi:hypothetical protein
MNNTASHHLRRRWATRLCRAVPAVLLIVTAVLAAGCGGGSASNKPGDALALQWTQCMQQHGIDANASVNGNGQRNIQINRGGASQQQLQAAENACKKYQPNGGQSGGQLSAQQLDQLAKYAQCMNQHGIPVQQHGGSVYVQGPQVDPRKDQQAQQACQHFLPTPGPGSGSGS